MVRCLLDGSQIGRVKQEKQIRSQIQIRSREYSCHHTFRQSRVLIDNTVAKHSEP